MTEQQGPAPAQQQEHFPVHFDIDYTSGTTVVWRGPNAQGNYVTFDWYAFKRFSEIKGFELKAKDGDKITWQGWEIWASYFKEQKHHTVFKRWVGEGPAPVKRYVEWDSVRQMLGLIVERLDRIDHMAENLREQIAGRGFW